MKDKAELAPERNVRQPHKLSERLSDDTIEQLMCGYQAGTASTALATEHGLSEYAVRQALLWRGVCMRLQQMDEAEIALAVERYESGLRIKDVALELGRAESTIWKALTDAGVNIEPMRRRGLTDEQREDVVTRYGRGESLIIIAEAIGVAGSTVHRALQRAGATMRPAGGAPHRQAAEPPA